MAGTETATCSPAPSPVPPKSLPGVCRASWATELGAGQPRGHLTSQHCAGKGSSRPASPRPAAADRSHTGFSHRPTPRPGDSAAHTTTHAGPCLQEQPWPGLLTAPPGVSLASRPTCLWPGSWAQLHGLVHPEPSAPGAPRRRAEHAGPAGHVPRQPISGQQLQPTIGRLEWAGLPPANQQGMEAGGREGRLCLGSSRSKLQVLVHVQVQELLSSVARTA